MVQTDMDINIDEQKYQLQLQQQQQQKLNELYDTRYSGDDSNIGSYAIRYRQMYVVVVIIQVI